MSRDAAGAGPHWTAFDGYRRIAWGPPHEAALALRRAADRGARGPLLVFDDATGAVVDVDTRGTDEEIVARHAAAAPPTDAPESTATEPASPGPRGRGRPKLGVVAREVTLLPRHWEWLNAQPGGASVALRRLVDEARRTHAARDQARAAREACYRFIHAVAGDLPDYEEASRALFASDRPRFARTISRWPTDVREYALMLMGAGSGMESESQR